MSEDYQPLKDQLKTLLTKTLADLESDDLFPYMVTAYSGTAGGRDTTITFITRDARSLAEEVEELKDQLARIKEVVQ